jgi:hypothetical protein
MTGIARRERSLGANTLGFLAGPATRLYIGGEWTEPIGGASIDVIDPADESSLRAALRYSSSAL